MKNHYIQKAAQSHISAGATMPVREVQLHECETTWIDAGGATQRTTARAWYIQAEDGLHGQFHSEAEADQFAATH